MSRRYRKFSLKLCCFPLFRLSLNTEDLKTQDDKDEDDSKDES